MIKNKQLLSILISAIICLPFTAFLYSDTAQVYKTKGDVNVQRAGVDTWQPCDNTVAVKEGDKIKTGKRSKCSLTLVDGSKAEIGSKSTVSCDELKSEGISFGLIIGKIRSWVSKSTSRKKYNVKTPSALCAVRGTDFEASVDETEKTTIQVNEGFVGVSKEGYAEIVLKEGQQLEVEQGKPFPTPEEFEKKEQQEESKKELKKEVGLSMTKDEIQAAAAEELRLAEYIEGKTLIDVFGERVRLEEYITRPAVDTFKLVVLNERKNRYDYFYYKGKCNKTLPDDLSVALKDLNGKIGTQPEYYLTAYEKGWSNTRDYIKDNASGGHLVQTAGDDVVTIYDPATESFKTVGTNEFYWNTLFNNYTHIINGKTKSSYEPFTANSNVTTMSENVAGGIKWTYAGLSYANGGRVFSLTESPSGENKLHEKITLYYYDQNNPATTNWEKYDNYIINDEGKIGDISAFEGKSGSSYKQELLKWNYQQVITSSEFGDRKIDLVIEPKILFRSGLK